MKKKILYTLLVLVVLFLALFFVLKNGFSISSIHLNFVNLEQLYIKLDKKLILRAKNISFKQDSNSSTNLKTIEKSVHELVDIATNLNYFYTFFQEVDIEKILINDNHVRILYKDNEFFLHNNFLLANLSLHSQPGALFANIKNIHLTDYNADIEGNLSIGIKNKFYSLNAKINSPVISFNTLLNYRHSQLSYKFEDINIQDITKLFAHIQEKIILPKSLVEWVIDKARAEFYHFHFLQGFADLRKNNFYFNDISASATATNVEVKLDKVMNAIKIPNLDLNLSKQKIDFYFPKASYNNGDLSGSKVYLYDIFDDKKMGIYIKIKSNSLRFDEKLNNALKQYVFELPFYQTSGTMKSELELKIDFDESGEVLYNGSFTLNNVGISLADFVIKQANVKLKQDDLRIENASAKNEFLDSNFNANINLQTKKGSFDTHINRLHFEGLLDISNQDTILNLDYTKDILLSIPKWQLEMNFNKGLTLTLNDLNLCVQNSSLLQGMGIIGGKSITYNSTNFDDFDAQLTDMKFNGSFLKADKSVYENDTFYVTRQKGVTKISSKSNLASATITSNLKEIHLKNLIYVYKNDKEGKEFNIEDYKENIELGGANVGVILKDFNKTLNFDKLEFSLKNSTMQATASKNKANFRLHMSKDKLSLVAKNMDDNFINTFLGKQAFKEGNLSLYVRGDNLKFLNGRFELSNTYVKDLKGTNNLISFIDTIPSLLLFKSPTFNNSGLKFEEGVVAFEKKKDLINFTTINLNGDSVDIYGLGNANLSDNSVDFNLELKTLKSATTAIASVPILNYVLLGKNKEISTILKVDGSIDNPQFHTQILLDTLKTPFNLIRNIIMLPVNLFDFDD
ncbi:DUF3971 domain-containing protein [Campylobacter sp. LR291e]|uniref:YhdP family protein n=1 Tax=unclassified Campylobacter TaxID=2593542 RepID=UPI001237CEF5|nr:MULTISPECIES: AsmA-like C-terminal domain-containing protein [unclassified Campylobacter]KAA6226955.1 DUF3971 domain-containing protein [Campylobacter sp. LR185c]KAA6234314.1 DUF3971 domain-containing protein [Campylobacter sp. LR291e]KAA6234533.1 DUF3971 domain-containing protein [Campylobacter sp. LR264d]KAA8604076.1 hypothetical protein CGP82_03965 [Campylobacter sp. LR185c]